MEPGKPGGDVVVGVSNDTVPAAEQLVRQLYHELQQLLEQRAQIKGRIGTAKRTIAGLAAIFGDTVLRADVQELMSKRTRARESGLTSTCRAILMQAGHALSAHEVRKQMQERTPTLVGRQKDPIASITTILNRLVDYGEAQRVVSGGNTRAWQWVVEPSSKSRRTNGSNGTP
jgi:hypothetical protein